jgi:ketosteroid isomerase-like protein
MKNLKRNKIQLLLFLVVSVLMTSCEQKASEQTLTSSHSDMSILKKEIELRLQKYESYLKNGDSVALGKMYTLDAEIIPSTIGRNDITKAFGRMIRDSVTGSSFNTTKLWGNKELLVEEGTGTWYHTNGVAVSSGRYLLVWKKDNGKWNILRDTWFPYKKK